MALLDFLKKKEEQEQAKKGEKLEAPVKKASASAKASADEPVKKTKAPAKAKTAKAGFSYDIVKEPHISEKATVLAEANQYTFEVLPQANKTEIKKAVAGIYGVDVLSVNIVKIPRKKRRLGRTQGFRKAYVKAIVTIKEGQKIEIL